ncbi:MAG: hypothetical protein RLZZ540_2798 [Bacteroidota bacterium]|jgi:hypothetical protein
MKTAILKTIEKIIETPFVEDEFELGSVCFANDEDLRADFKLHFTIYDVVNYVYGVINQLYWKENEKIEISLLKIPYPANSSSFWKYSSIGKKFRQEHPVQEMEFIVVSELNWESV